jgi:hypothetical protein
MRYLLIFLCSISFAKEVGWVDGSWVADSVVSTGIKSVAITSDNQQVDVNGYAIINLDSDSSVSANRSVVVLPGKIVGQRIRITCRPVGGNSQIDDNTAIPGAGSIKLVNNWVCNQDGNSLNLFWNGTDWEEDGRAIL